MKHLIILLSVFFIYSCGNPQIGNSKDGVEAKAEVAKVHEGKTLMEKHCYACHNPNTSMENLIAPPLAGIRRQYLKDNPTKDAFTQDMVNFINNPTEENAKIDRAVKRFGVMPKMVYTEEDLEKIADYLYDNEPEKPDWFEAHYEEHHGKNKGMGKGHGHSEGGQGEGYLPKGKKMALQTKQVLGKNLMNALNTKGTEHAMQFCSTRAMPLTDSMSTALASRVKRVSDNNRNPKNAANALELEYIQQAKAQIAKGESPSPQMQRIGNKHVGYYPIVTSQMCLQCHGTPNEQVKPATLALIKELYPNDKALGYGENELRGIFVVEMD